MRKLVIFFYILCSCSALYAAGQPVVGSEVATKPGTLYHVTVVSADVEYSQTITNVKSLWFQCQTAADFRYAYVTGKVATPTAPYMTLKSGQVYEQYNLDISSMTLYFAGDTDGLTVEIEKW